MTKLHFRNANYSCFKVNGTIFVYSTSISHLAFFSGNNLKINQKFDSPNKAKTFQIAETPVLMEVEGRKLISEYL